MTMSDNLQDIGVGGILGGLAVILTATTTLYAARAGNVRQSSLDFEARRRQLIEDIQHERDTLAERVAVLERENRLLTSRIEVLERQVLATRATLHVVYEVAKLGGDRALVRIMELTEGAIGGSPNGSTSASPNIAVVPMTLPLSHDAADVGTESGGHPQHA